MITISPAKAGSIMNPSIISPEKGHISQKSIVTLIDRINCATDITILPAIVSLFILYLHNKKKTIIPIKNVTLPKYRVIKSKSWIFAELKVVIYSVF